jgi:oligoendopeptidase F
MKITVDNKMYDLRLTTEAVEKIEDKFDSSFGDLFVEGRALRAKDLNYILYCMADTTMPFEEFKVKLSKEFTYPKCMALLTEAFEIKNDEVVKA